MTPLDALLVAVAGLACGIVNSIAGGGSLLLFPALLATGMSPLAANVTNSMATWPGYAGGVFGFRYELRDQGPGLRPMAVATVVGSAFGSALLLLTPEGAFDVVVPFLVLAATALTALQPRARRRLLERRGEAPRAIPTATIGIGLASIYGGYFGGALGVIYIAVLGLTMTDSLRRLNAAKGVLTLVDATVGVLIFAVFGPVQWVAVAVAAPGALVGGFVGAKVARRLDEQALRVGVVTVGLVVGVALLVRAAT